MRWWLTPFALTCLLATSGCGGHAPLTPVLDRSAESGLATPFVLTSALDPRLPAPLLEASNVPGAELTLVAAATEARSAPVRSSDSPAVFWSERCTEHCLAGRLPPPLVARAYALTEIAIHDAMIASRHPRRAGLPDRAAAAGAASSVMMYLFPSDASAILSTALAEAGLTRNPTAASIRAWLLGRVVGHLLVIHGQNDRSGTQWDGEIPVGEGLWTGTDPVLPLCGTWRTWITSSGDEFQPEPPFAYGSPEDLADVESVREASLHRTAEQIAIVHRWADLPPPTIWCGLLNDRIRRDGLDAFAAARAHAFLHAAMYDAFVSCWRTKYRYWTARPNQRIPSLATVVPTPNFPTYTSGHSTISGAAAQVMAELFPKESEYFRSQANEAALSRFWGGIHFHHDDNAGLDVGRRIGAKVVGVMTGRGGGA